MELPDECRNNMEYGMKMINLIGENNLYDVVGIMYDCFDPTEVQVREFESMMAFVIDSEIPSDEKIEILEEERKIVEDKLKEIDIDDVEPN